MILEFCDWLQETAVSVAIRESTLMFPVLEGSHLLALGASAGAIAISDLRMMGVIFRKQRVDHVFDQVFPWMFVGFLFMFITGVFLFWSEPMRCYESIWFRYKMLFIVFGVINAGIYEITLRKRVTEWGHLESPPAGAKFAGAFSILVWALVIITGRTMAYNF